MTCLATLCSPPTTATPLCPTPDLRGFETITIALAEVETLWGESCGDVATLCAWGKAQPCPYSTHEPTDPGDLAAWRALATTFRDRDAELRRLLRALLHESPRSEAHRQALARAREVVG